MILPRTIISPRCFGDRCRCGGARSLTLPLLLLGLAVTGSGPAGAQELDQSGDDPAIAYESVIKPILEEHCYDCHGYGSAEGDLALDQFETAEQAMAAPERWWRVSKFLRAGIMPPTDALQPSDADRRKIQEWIKAGPFQIDPQNLDPGPVTVRRLNRDEYGNTIRELMGVQFEEKLLFPPDDSGHGFDNVADALMVSPLLLDKYIQAAEMVVEQAVPTETWIVPRQDLDGSDFKSTDPDDSRKNGRRLDGKEAAEVSQLVEVDEDGRYLVRISIKQHGSFEFDPARYVASCLIDGEQRFSQELGWDEHKRTDFQYEEDWQVGQHEIAFQIDPVVPESVEGEELLEENRGTSVSFEVDSVSIEGPLGTERRVHPAHYERFFTRDEPPAESERRSEYAAEVLQRFATRAFRGRVEQATLDRLVAIAHDAYSRPDMTFESGIGRAIVAALMSPKFLFRIETPIDAPPDALYAPVDELSLASRLSYFLWSSMPDEELFALAEAGKLREQLPEQVDRMLADPRAEAFVSNFVGQWLRTRDVPNMAVDPAVVLGYAEEMAELREWLSSRFRRGRGRGRGDMSDEDRAKFERFREIRAIVDRIDGDLKRAMQDETEKFMEHIVRSDASLLDLLDCDYTFLNEKLAEHYGIPGVKGREMRLVPLPEESPRGGVLTQASMLLVTSNPTRTSPVKRGLFVLDNLLGTPAPPPPGVVPELEESANNFPDHEPTLRELLEVHRASDLCSSCHSRMDPIGLALENFDALGAWRDQDGDAPIEPQGMLYTGETFEDVRSLKRLLREHHAEDFYRCVSEKLLVFAMGRGVEYSDEETIDRIVQRLTESGGKFPTLVQAIVESAPFQKQRIPSAVANESLTQNP